MNIIQKLCEKGFDTVPKEFYAQIAIWQSWYNGNVKDFHHFQVFNGRSRVQCRRYTLGMAKKIAEDWANLLMNEKVKITLEGSREQAFFDEVCRNNNFWVRVNEMQEVKAGVGTAAYVARITDAELRPGTGEVSGGGKIKLDYVSAPNIFPLRWENGRVIECAFTGNMTVQEHKYLYLQVHRLGDDRTYIIENSIYSDQAGALTEVPLGSVRGFERVPPSVRTGSVQPQFVLDRLNIANNVNRELPMGIPAFANAIDQLKGADVAYDSYVNEFVLGKKRIMVKPAATNYEDGSPVFDPNELVYYVLPEDTKSDGIVQPIDMTLRTQEHNAGLQDMLNALSSRCGFGENHYRFGSGGVSTATQVISENSTLFRTIKKHELILEDVLVRLCRIILRLGNRMGAGLNEEVEVSVDFDDSIIEDKATDFARDMQMLSAGILNDWEFRMKWRNEDEATARAALPRMEDMATEKQNEVE